MMMPLIIFMPIFLIGLLLTIWFLYDKYQIQKKVSLLAKLGTNTIISQEDSSKTESSESLRLKLIQAGVTFKEYYEVKILFIFVGVMLATILPFFVIFEIAIGVVIFGIICIFFGGNFFMYLWKKERIGKIEKDLGVFLDLINVILEAGSGLRNAFFKVSRDGQGIINDELLKEIAILEYEMANYSTQEAYDNMKKRIDSREVDKVLDFLSLSEETGLGVKDIFSIQSDELRQKKFYQIKGKVNTLSLYLTIIIFIFILPTLGAFIIFPMMEGSLNMGL